MRKENARLSLTDVVSNIDFRYTPAAGDRPAYLELPANIADIQAISDQLDIGSAWTVYQFAVPKRFDCELGHIKRLFETAMKERRYGRG